MQNIIFVTFKGASSYDELQKLVDGMTKELKLDTSYVHTVHM